TIVDRELFGFAFKAAGLLANEGLKSYLKAKIDFANVMAMFRMRKLGWPVERFADVYIPGGKYKLELFQEAYGSSPVDAARLFQDGYDDKVARIVRDQTEKRNFALTEAVFAELLLEVVEHYRDDSFQIGPIIYYHLEKAREADAVRTLYARAEFNRPGA
ncbi:MAG: V-type ATPase subunit, partial [Bacillota bacterium]|nr:V-type ATPase subunit [Bacillota bacterium]